MTIATIVGAGMMGTGIAYPLVDNGHEVRLVGTHLDDAIIENVKKDGYHPKHKRVLPTAIKAYYYSELAEALEGAELIICGVSSPGVRWFVEKVGPFFKPELPVLLITKGLVAAPNGDLQIIPDFMEGLLQPNQKGRISFNAVAGPCIAQELAARRQTCVNFCGRDLSVLESLQQIFTTDYYHVFLTTDFVGAETGVALKNAYAIAINLAVGEYQKHGADGIAYMYNPQAALFAQSMHEMRLITQMMGGNLDGIVDLTGSGDLYVTVFGGRNSRLGQLMGQGLSYQEALNELGSITLEGVQILTQIGTALPKLEARGLVKTSSFPLLMHLFDVIQHGEKVNIPWQKFFREKHS